MAKDLPFNKPTFIGTELQIIEDLLKTPSKHAQRFYTNKCLELFAKDFPEGKLFLCNSASGALDLLAQLIKCTEGDEIILPSYTFVSAANAFVNDGFIPVFADIDPNTLSVSAGSIEALITDKTKAIMTMHYGGRTSEVEAIQALAKKHNLLLIEDASHCVGVQEKGRGLGSFGDFGILSFDSTKNLSSGHGGLLVLNNLAFAEEASEIYEIGTNKSAFIKQEVPYYEWVNKGRKYALSEVNAAMLYAQLLEVDKINSERLQLWNTYYATLKPLEDKGFLKLAKPVENTNAHIFYLILSSEKEREELRLYLKSNGISAVSHYVPLHESKMGKSFAHLQKSTCDITSDISKRLLRLPLFYTMSAEDLRFVSSAVKDFFSSK